MNNDDLEMELGLNAKDVEIGMQAIADACKIGNLALKDFAVRLVETNSTGRTFELALKTLPPGIEKVTVTLKESASGWDLVSSSIRHTVDTIKSAVQIIKQTKDALFDSSRAFTLYLDTLEKSGQSVFDKLLKGDAQFQAALAAGRTSAVKSTTDQLAQFSANADKSNAARAAADRERLTAEREILTERRSAYFQSIVQGQINEKNELIDKRVVTANLVAVGKEQLAREIELAHRRVAVEQNRVVLLKQLREAELADNKKWLQIEMMARTDDARTGRAGRKARGQAPSTMDTIGDALSSRFLGANLASMAITRGINFARRELTGALHATIEYERALVSLQIVTGQTAKETGALGEKLLTVSTKFGLKTADVQSAALEIFKNKATAPADALGLLNSASLLARASGQSVAEAAKAIDMQLQIFGQDATHHLEVAELLQQAWKNDGGSLTELNSSLAKVETVLEPMGVTMGEQVNMLTAFAKQGINASTAAERIVQAVIRMDSAIKSDPNLQIKLRVQSFQQLIENTGSAKAAYEAFIAANQRGAGSVGTSVFGQAAFVSASKMFEAMKDLNTEQHTLEKDAKTAQDSLAGEWDTVVQKIEVAKIKLIEFLKIGIIKASKVPSYQPTSGYSDNDTPNNPNNPGYVGFGVGEGLAGGIRLRNAMTQEAFLTAAMQLANEARTKNEKEALAQRFQLAQADFAAIRGQLIDHNRKMDVEDKERNENVKANLDVQLRRFEDTVRTESEIASKAKGYIKSAEDHLADAGDKFETGRFGRQLGITKNPRGQQQLIAQRNQQLTTSASALVSHFGTLTGEGAANSKDIENARAKMEEVEARAQDHFNKLAQSDGSRQQLMAAEGQIVSIAEKRKALEEQILKISRQQEETAKAKADALKVQFNIAQQATREALEVKTKEKDETRDQSAILSEFDEKRDRALKAMAKAGLTPDAQQAATFQFDAARKQLEDRATRENKLKELNEKSAEYTKMFANGTPEVKEKAIEFEAALSKMTTALQNTAKIFGFGVDDSTGDTKGGVVIDAQGSHGHDKVTNERDRRIKQIAKQDYETGSNWFSGPDSDEENSQKLIQQKWTQNNREMQDWAEQERLKREIHQEAFGGQKTGLLGFQDSTQGPTPGSFEKSVQATGGSWFGGDTSTASSTTTNNNGHTTINVNGAGQKPEELALAIRRLLDQQRLIIQGGR